MIITKNYDEIKIVDILATGFDLIIKYKLVDNENQIFQSPSGASQFVLGKTSNGRTDWKTDDGKTFKEIEEMLSKKE